MSHLKQGAGKTRTTLFQTDAFEVVSIEWMKGHESASHDHGWSTCSVLVQAGQFQNVLDLGGKLETQIFEVGDVITTPLRARHELRCLTSNGKTLHIYSPRLVDTAPALPVFESPDRALDRLRESLKLSAETPLPEVCQLLKQIENMSISTESPYFMNQLFSGVSPQMLMAEELISRTRTTMATNEASPVFSMIEKEVIDRLGEQIGWKTGQRDGVSVPGGSAANMLALHCARHRHSPAMKKQGSSGEKFRIFVSTDAHYSFKKACLALGLGLDALIQVATDSRGRLNPDNLNQKIAHEKSLGHIPLLVGATLGTTVHGAFDPLNLIADVCNKHGIWLHADAAWGAPALFSKKLAPHIQGLERADSVTFDAHKFLGANLTCSFLLTRHPGALLEANDVSGADYLFHDGSDHEDLGRKSWQCGRRPDAASFWTIWKSYGTKGLGEQVDRLLDIRDLVTAWIKTEPRLKLVSEPEFLNICVRVLPPAEGAHAASWSRHVRTVLKESNLAMVNFSSDADGDFLRIILVHPDLKLEHLQNILRWSLNVD